MSTNQKFLKEREVGVSQHHKDFLGLDVPENYFANSKSKILAATMQKETKIVKIEKKNQNFKIYSIAASIALLISLSFWFFYNPKNDDFPTHKDLIVSSEDVLINSILLNDTDFESYTNQLLIDEVVIKAELSEQKLDNMFLNSLFVEDSLLDNYTNEKLIEQIIL